MGRSGRGILLCLAGSLVAILLLVTAAGGQEESRQGEDERTTSQNDDSKAKRSPGFFIPIEGAKDCAYDHVRHRLYVTTLAQLVVIDIKKREIAESIDLLGNVQGLDIAPQAKFLVIAPIGGQFVYKLKLDWKSVDDISIDRIKFKPENGELGVFSIGVGADGSVLFSTTFSGSGWVKLRRLNVNDTIVDLAKVRMDSVIAISGDRTKAFIGEGNISSGPLWGYDFKQKSQGKLTDLNCFYYELAASADGSRLARPHGEGCDLYDVRGGKLGTLSGAPVIGAAFNPKGDTLYVMRHGEVDIQEYDTNGKRLPTSYPLDKPLVIRGDVRSTVIANLHPIGRDAVLANFRRVTSVNHRMYESGRLHVAEDGKSLSAVVPGGVYVFPIEAPVKSTTPKSKVKINDK